MFLHSWILFLGGETNKVMNASDKYYDDSVRVYWNSYREGCSRKETLGLRSKCWEECLAKSWRRSGRHKECRRLKAATMLAYQRNRKRARWPEDTVGGCGQIMEVGILRAIEKSQVSFERK